MAGLTRWTLLLQQQLLQLLPNDDLYLNPLRRPIRPTDSPSSLYLLQSLRLSQFLPKKLQLKLHPSQGENLSPS